MISKQNLNLMSTGDTLIFTPIYAGLDYMISAILLKCTEATSVSNVASISVGTNATNYDNILPITPLTNLTTSGNFIRLPIDGVSDAVSKDTQIFVKITTGAIGTSQVVTIYLDGFYG